MGQEMEIVSERKSRDQDLRRGQTEQEGCQSEKRNKELEK